MAAFKVPQGPYQEMDALMRQLGNLLGLPSRPMAPPREQEEASEAEPPVEVAPPAEPLILSGEAADDLESLIQAIERTKDITPEFEIRSHRPMVGRGIDALKKFIFWAVRPQILKVVENQNRFNEAALAQQKALIEDYLLLRGKIREELERHNVLQENLAKLAVALRSAVESFSGRLKANEARHDLGAFFSEIPPAKRLELMDQFRGSRADISGRLAIYVDHFRNRPGPALDVGCGRGEFLKLLQGAGIEAWGCDVDPATLELCAKEGVCACLMNALDALESVPDASLGGIFSAQVIEHMFPGELLAFIRLARRKIAPGGVHGFLSSERLPDLPEAEALGITPEARAALAMVIHRLNEVIYGPQDYYVVGEIPSNHNFHG
ncbi:class I SAM-dependent methyltransferase [Candidatus Sumerlaeota bacterium]|nr:class I SAM-dependent methyltransferase [Candidatus Sumerlaeota bacterium]